MLVAAVAAGVAVTTGRAVVVVAVVVQAHLFVRCLFRLFLAKH
jgi:hypothetical protein